jgi:dipeptidase E
VIDVSNILLSSRAFKTTAITDAFHNLLIHSANNAPSITVIVNSVKEGKMHPKIIELQQRLKQLGFNDVTLLDVLHDDLSILNQTSLVILNGGYQFYLLHCLKKSGAFNLLKERIKDGMPVYGISAGALVLGPDINMYQYLYPEDNWFADTDLSAIGATKIRIYPHFDQHIQLDPQLATKLRHWEIVKNQTITRLTNQEALLIENDRVIKL